MSKYLHVWWKKILAWQFARFLLIGCLNTGSDFLIVNILAHLTNTYQGFNLIIFNSISFVLVVTLSFYLNKSWTFARNYNGAKSLNRRKYLFFFGVNILGLIFNNLIIYCLTTIIGPHFGLSQFWWLNLSKAGAIGIVLFWNYFNFKYIVFKD
jgi:putative flippase GtrA